MHVTYYEYTRKTCASEVEESVFYQRNSQEASVILVALKLCGVLSQLYGTETVN